LPDRSVAILRAAPATFQTPSHVKLGALLAAIDVLYRVKCFV
jgi:hypothetical protein